MVDTDINIVTLRKRDGTTVRVSKGKLDEDSANYMEKAFTQIIAFRKSLALSQPAK